jgi:hypothetical protein
MPSIAPARIGSAAHRDDKLGRFALSSLDAGLVRGAHFQLYYTAVSEPASGVLNAVDERFSEHFGRSFGNGKAAPSGQKDRVILNFTGLPSEQPCLLSST